MKRSTATRKVLEQLEAVCKAWYALPKESLPLTDEEWENFCHAIDDEFTRLEQRNKRLRTRVRNQTALITGLQQQIRRREQQIDQLCAADLRKKDMHKIICDQAQVISDLLRDRKTV